MAEEQKLQSRIIEDLKNKKLFPMKIIKATPNGMPDILVLTKDGLHFWIEVKAKKGVLSEIQKYQIKQLKDRGDIVGVVYSYEEYSNFIKTLDFI